MSGSAKIGVDPPRRVRAAPRWARGIGPERRAWCSLAGGLRRIATIGAGLLACSAPGAAPEGARTILFIGNSFTYGANSPVQHYHPERVADLNGQGIGGVPALFKTFTDEAGLDWSVSLETSPGKDLSFHLASARAVIDQPWDTVVLQGHSLLDPERPGDPAGHIAAAHALAALFHRRNARARIDLVATWSRADQTYRPGGHWYGKPITRMAEDLAAATRQAIAGRSGLHAAIEVGSAWNRAMREGLADPDPFDGIAFGQIDLWSWDQYHASAEGYYLEALMIFGTVTGLDPRMLDGREKAADDLGIEPKVAERLRGIAAAELAAEHPAPHP